MAVHNVFIVMHDGAPCCTSNEVSEYLSKSKGVVLNWLEKSPDLNPIENLRSYMKNKNKAAEKQTSSSIKLLTATKEVWVKKIDLEYCAFQVKECFVILLQ